MLKMKYKIGHMHGDDALLLPLTSVHQKCLIIFFFIVQLHYMVKYTFLLYELDGHALAREPLPGVKKFTFFVDLSLVIITITTCIYIGIVCLILAREQSIRFFKKKQCLFTSNYMTSTRIIFPLFFCFNRISSSNLKKTF